MPRGARTNAATMTTPIEMRLPNDIPSAATKRFGSRSFTVHRSSTAPDE